MELSGRLRTPRGAVLSPSVRGDCHRPGHRMEAGPLRTCVGCRSKRPQQELIRIGRSSDGAVSIGAAGPGRGAYLCRNRDCIGAAFENDRLARALRSKRLPEGLQHELMRKGSDG